MTKLPNLFFAAGALFAMVGMLWGIQMSISQDHSLAPAHGHLNLIGFVAMSIFGAFYALNPRAASSKLAPIHFWLTAISVVVLVPGIVMAVNGTSETLAKIGSLLAVLSMGLFGYIVLTQLAGRSDTVATSEPAE